LYDEVTPAMQRVAGRLIRQVGLTKEANQPYRTLSSGERMRCLIARALVLEPRLLVLDEPTEGIQPSIIKDISRVIALLRSQGAMAILLVEQYFDFARDLAQTIVVMDRGDVVLSGRREELNEEDVRRRLSV
jgi:urea transport system ATP-binding protein